MKAARYDDTVWPVGSEVKISWLRLLQVSFYTHFSGFFFENFRTFWKKLRDFSVFFGKIKEKI